MVRRGRGVYLGIGRSGSVRGRARGGSAVCRAAGALVFVIGVVILATCIGTWLWPLGWVAALWGATGVQEG